MAELKPCNARNYKHGAYMKNPRLYGVWTTMMHRCYDDKRSKYQFIHDFFRAMFRRILKAPTIAPASLRPKGEWIYNTDDFTPKKRCTNCGYNKPLVAGEAIKQEPDNFCNNCGADMRGETHDS